MEREARKGEQREGGREERRERAEKAEGRPYTIVVDIVPGASIAASPHVDGALAWSMITKS